MFYQWIFDFFLFIIEMQSIFLVHNSKFFIHISTNLETLVILKVKSTSYLFFFSSSSSQFTFTFTIFFLKIRSIWYMKVMIED